MNPLSPGPQDPAASPRPSVEALQRKLGAQLSTRVRVLMTALLLVDLGAVGALGALWITEPELPARTHLAFGLMMLFALAWCGFLLWTLLRRRVLLARQRVIAGWMGCGFSVVFVVGALLLAWLQPVQRPVGLGAAAFGGLLLGVAAILLVRARRRLSQLLARRRELEQGLAG